MTKALSVSRPDPGAPDGVSPDASLPRLSREDAARVADYLDAGAVVARTTARAIDPWLDPPAARVPLTKRTDGTWRWDDEVSYYVRNYGLSPGAEFLNYLHQRNFTPPTVSPEQVSAVIDELFGNPTQTPQPRLALDGTQLLARDYYCIYQGRAFRCDVSPSQVKLFVPPGEPIPEGFERRDDRDQFVQAIAYKRVPADDIEAFYRAITTCWYKGDPYSIRRIDGPRLRLSLDGGRRIKRTIPEPPHPTLKEISQFPNTEVLGQGDVWATIEIQEAARLTMAIVPYHQVGGHLKPVRDVTGAGVAVPKADEIFYFPSPRDSPFLPANDAITTITAHLAAHDPSYPTTGLTPQRLRDGWRLNPTTETPTIYYITDDKHIITAPATAPTAHIASQMSAEFRSRHPIVDPPPAHDTGTDIFD